MSLWLATAGAWADEVRLTHGGVVRGRLIAETAADVTVEFDGGTIGIPRERIDSITRSRGPLDEFDERLAALGVVEPTAEAFAELGGWAKAQGLSTRARSMFQRALQIDPGNETARRGLDFVRVGGQWMTREDANRAMGLVPDGGRWISKAEQRLREVAEAERAAARAHAAARPEAESRATTRRPGPNVFLGIPTPSNRPPQRTPGGGVIFVYAYPWPGLFASP
jgi:hypothetical protein